MFSLLREINPLTFRKRRQSYKEVSKTVDGKTMLHDLLNACGNYKAIRSNDPILIARQEGARDIGLHILSMLNMTDHETDELINKMNEQHKEL